MKRKPVARVRASAPARTRISVLLALVAGAVPIQAQLSLTTAVSLALKNSPKVKMAGDDLAKAVATLQASHAVYIPAVSAGAAIGQAYGYSPYPPTLFTGEAQSLIYNRAQFAYDRSARAGIDAAQLGLKDAREAVAEDVALTYAALLKDADRESALRQQVGFAQRLIDIVQDRFDAGRDTAIDLTQSKLTLAQLNLAQIHAEDDTLNDQAHLAMLTSLPATALTVDGTFPAVSIPENFIPGQDSLGPGVSAAFANARAREQQANGDSHFLYRPYISLVVQYNRYATFTQSFQNIQQEDKNNNIILSANSQIYGVQVNIPLFDKGRQARARETVAEAAHMQHEAENIRQLALDGQVKLIHSIRELRARMEVATLDRQLSQQQLDALVTELNLPPVPGRPPLTPKDEQNSRIAERDKYLALIDTTFQMRQLEINLLRQTGRLDEWLRTAVTAAPQPTP